MASGGAPTVEGMNIDGVRDYLVRTEVVFAVLFGSHARSTAFASLSESLFSEEEGYDTTDIQGAAIR